MKSYGQYCALAKALDVIGNRWSILIIRELMIRGPSRYTDVRNGLPGIATNLLVERLGELEGAGILTRTDAPPPIATHVYSLSERGRALEPILLQLGGWGAELLQEDDEKEQMLAHWLVPPLRLYLRDNCPGEESVALALDADGTPITVAVEAGHVDVRLGPAPIADLRISGPAHEILRLMSGRMEIDQAHAAGIECHGDLEILKRLLPDPVST